jgi:hypothetical protein
MCVSSFFMRAHLGSHVVVVVGGGGDGGAVRGDGWQCSGGGGDKRQWGATSVADGRWTVSKGQAVGSVQIEKGIKKQDVSAQLVTT